MEKYPGYHSAAPKILGSNITNQMLRRASGVLCGMIRYRGYSFQRAYGKAPVQYSVNTTEGSTLDLFKDSKTT